LFEVGAVVREGVQPKSFTPGQTLQIVAGGYHVERKAMPIALHALAKLGQSIPYEMVIMGTGPAQEKWKALTEQLGLGDRVRWTGNLPHAQALDHMARGHVFVIPSVKEGLPNVVAEAMSFGVPVICHNCCGMAQFVTNESGIRIELGSPHASIERFAEAIKRIATTPGELEKLSAGALRRANEVTWDSNAKRFAEAYTKAVASRTA
jgi:glycosyltransferase involved in cell wall biosynthesis